MMERILGFLKKINDWIGPIEMDEIEKERYRKEDYRAAVFKIKSFEKKFAFRVKDSVMLSHSFGVEKPMSGTKSSRLILIQCMVESLNQSKMGCPVTASILFDVSVFGRPPNKMNKNSFLESYIMSHAFQPQPIGQDLFSGEKYPLNERAVNEMIFDEDFGYIPNQLYKGPSAEALNERE